MSVQSQAVKTIIGISIVELFEYFQLTQASFVPSHTNKLSLKILQTYAVVHLHDLVVAYNFDGHIGGTSRLITATYHVTEDTLAGVTAD